MSTVTYTLEAVKVLGNINAAILHEVIAEEIGKSICTENGYDEKGNVNWVPVSHEFVESKTGLTRKQQDTAIKIILKKGIWEKKILKTKNGLVVRHFR